MEFSNYSMEPSNFAPNAPEKRVKQEKITPLTQEQLDAMRFAFENHGECSVRPGVKYTNINDEPKNTEGPLAPTTPEDHTQTTTPENIDTTNLTDLETAEARGSFVPGEMPPTEKEALLSPNPYSVTYAEEAANVAQEVDWLFVEKEIERESKLARERAIRRLMKNIDQKYESLVQEES